LVPHTQAVAAGVRPQVARTADAGSAAVRRAVLSVAQQQRLAACSALLTEVALHYGFALHVAPDIGDEDAGACCPQSVPAHLSCDACMFQLGQPTASL
jgi:hypothetical protein